MIICYTRDGTSGCHSVSMCVLVVFNLFPFGALTSSAKFSVGANVTAMWCGMGDKDGKGRAAEVLVDSMNQWSNGTVLKVLEDDFGNNLYEIRFRKPDGSEEDDVYTLYGEYILPITS